MFDDIDNEIKTVKKVLRKKSKDYIQNFNQIKSFIDNEIEEIIKLKNLNQPIIPEINFDNIERDNFQLINKIKHRGCVIVRNVFNEQLINKLNKELEDYINSNNYYEDQKKKSDLDQYFSDLKSGKPQIFGLYWSKSQIEIRHSEQMAKVKRWLNNLWVYENDEYKVFDPNRELSYADRVRRREPGDDTLGLSPHCDAGSVERWTDKNYQKIYKEIFSDNFKNYDPFDAKYRDRTIEFESPAVAHVFRTFQGWTALTKQGPNDGTLQLIPIAKGMAYILTRALLNDVPENELCGSKLGKALSVNKNYHELLLKGLVSIPKMKPGDTIWWHPDIVHAVEDKHLGKNYSNVVYVGATPYCKKNLDYTLEQSKKFLEGRSPPDFAQEDYEINYKGRIKLENLSSIARKQLALEDSN
ncbi:DUF1479 domain-containing protein [Candidatus Pelagibacter ubique]|jgi:hypothetical protein|nr:DUF1479 family protein [Pelagibacterales bacterium]MDA7465354.1 DUF1479 domain-containing protein [Candidatus Pelagibacter ubique]MDA7477075.1 DUF1479 domain-containing protein [Candidatus Pelagibacter ubique]MDA7477390.1 DUF1479 domain-containing protein [Candidatus Pelagibacter ubique]MDA7486328.1 DUF1479 domain-containing protein [Candidatus Pelagibacter ubique]